MAFATISDRACAKSLRRRPVLRVHAFVQRRGQPGPGSFDIERVEGVHAFVLGENEPRSARHGDRPPCFDGGEDVVGDGEGRRHLVERSRTRVLRRSTVRNGVDRRSEGGSPRRTGEILGVLCSVGYALGAVPCGFERGSVFDQVDQIEPEVVEAPSLKASMNGRRGGRLGGS